MGRDSSQGVGEVLVREEVGGILPRGMKILSRGRREFLLEKAKCCDC